MTKKRKPLPEHVRRLSTTPSVNPRYRGATPADMARILLGKKPVCHGEKVSDKPSAVKMGI